MRIIAIGALPLSLVVFRGPLLKAMAARGHTVFAAANGRDPDTEAKLRALGMEYCPIRIARAGMNPLADAVTLFDLIRLLRRVQPDVVLSYTIKPVVYGGLAARLCGVRSIYSLVTGLGYAFVEGKSVRRRLARVLESFLYRLSLRHSRLVFFQNPDDCRAFTEMGLVRNEQVVVVNGSGVDLAYYDQQPSQDLEIPHEDPEVLRSDKPDENFGCIRFLLIARLLRDKGISEYVQAARILKRKYSQASFHLLGPFDPNPAGLKPEEVKIYEEEGVLTYHGQQKDVRPFIKDCHVYVLPSYCEGTPRSVLEAMAIGRAVITTDAPGCRETVKNAEINNNTEILECLDTGIERNSGMREFNKLKIGRNGILVPVRDHQALAAAMEFFIKQPEKISIMGRESRLFAEEKYDVHKVNAVILKCMRLA